MATNRLQVLYNHLEKEFSEAGTQFLAADKNRYEAKERLESILDIIGEARTKLARQPHAPTLKRIGRIETLTRKLLLNYETERRTVDALGYLIARLKGNLANEMFEPKMYDKIRAALAAEIKIAEHPEVSIIEPKQKTIRLMLISRNGIHYAIPVRKIVHKTVGSVEYLDLRGNQKTEYCDEYFKPVEMRPQMLRRIAEHRVIEIGGERNYRTAFRFYGRHFFLYGARLSYTIRTSGAKRNQTTLE